MCRTLGNDDVFFCSGFCGCLILPLLLPVAARLPLPLLLKTLPPTPPPPPAYLLLLLRDRTLEKEHVRLLRPWAPLGAAGCDDEDDDDDASADTGVCGSCWM